VRLLIGLAMSFAVLGAGTTVRAQGTAAEAATSATAETGAAVEPDAAPATAETGSTAPTPESVVPARPPKVAIVLAGDPDPAALAAIASLERVIGSDARVTMPSDPAMRASLRGEGSGDGLDDARAERRTLGLGEARDASHLAVLGELAGADLVLVVRAAHGAISATAFDVLRRSFYEGAIALEPIDDAEALHFVVRRARRAARPLEAGERSAVPEPPPPVVDPATAVPPEAIAADPPAHEPDFFEQYWPYFAAGALLVGAVVFVVLTTQTSSTPPPVLRFEVGGGS
jgi:hypothetical protein